LVTAIYTVKPCYITTICPARFWHYKGVWR